MLLLQALFGEWGPHSQPLLHTGRRAGRAKSAQALRSAVHNYPAEVYQHVRRYAQNPTDEFVKGLLSGPMSELAAGCGARIVPETTPRGTFTVRVMFEKDHVHSAPEPPDDKVPGYHRMEASELAATRPESPASPAKLGSDGEEEAGALASTVGDGLRPPQLQPPSGRERDTSYSPSFEPESPEGGGGKDALREALQGCEDEASREGEEGSQGGNRVQQEGNATEGNQVMPGVHMIDGVALPNTEGMSAQDEWRTRQLYKLLMQDPAANAEEIYAMDRETQMWKEAKGVSAQGREEAKESGKKFEPSPLVEMQQKEIARFKHTASVRGQMKSFSPVWESEVNQMRRTAGERRSKLEKAIQDGAVKGGLRDEVDSSPFMQEADAWQIRFESEVGPNPPFPPLLHMTMS